MDYREELLKEATSLGLDFPKNIPTEKLERMVNESKGPATKPEENQDDENTGDTGNTPDPEATIEAEQKAAAEKAEAEARAAAAAPKGPAPANETPKAPMTRKALLRKRIAAAKKKAMKTRIVTLTNKDNRENDVMTTAHLSFENQHFGLSKIVPLDVPVELEQALIDIAESTRITLHKDEIRDGKRTGNKVPVSVKKFAISYSQRQTTE